MSHPCTSCGVDLDQPPSLCTPCSKERDAHRAAKARARAEQLRARLTRTEETNR